MVYDPKKFISDVILENVQIRFRNFSGKAGRFNAEGERFFHVFLDPDVAEQMLDDGWNVKHLKPREDGDIPQAHIKVKVNFRGFRPPRIVLLTSAGKRAMPEEVVDMLDWCDIESCDVTLNPSKYDVNGSQGVSAYLKTLYVRIREDYLDQKYSDIPELDARPQQLAIDGEIIEEAEIVEDDNHGVLHSAHEIEG